MVSPAPTNKKRNLSKRSKIWRANPQAAYATDTALAPISVSERTRFAVENVRWNKRDNLVEMLWC